MKGEVKDTVQVLTSGDGRSFTERGEFKLNLRRKDVPINHMMPDDESATGFTYDLVMSEPVAARYVRFAIEPQRTLTVSEVQVLDAITYQPFDLRIALPEMGKGRFENITDEAGVSRLVDEHYASHPNWWLSGLHLVDLDGDGDLDLFLSAHGKGQALAALNDGRGHFVQAPGQYPSSEIHLAYDSNEDGLLDLTMTHQDGGGRWWLNRSRPGELRFEPTDIMRGTNTARRQAMIDINRDGKVDWLRGTDSDIQFDFGDGKGVFTQGSFKLTVTRGRD